MQKDTITIILSIFGFLLTSAIIPLVKNWFQVKSNTKILADLKKQFESSKVSDLKKDLQYILQEIKDLKDDMKDMNTKSAQWSRELQKHSSTLEHIEKDLNRLMDNS